MTNVARDDSTPAAIDLKWRRRALLALLVMLPFALAIRCQDAIRTWLNDTDLLAHRIPFDGSGEVGGAEWRVVSLQRIASRPDGSAIALLRLQAKVLDADEVSSPPCRIALVDSGRRRWIPHVLPPTEASRAIRQAGDEGQRCGPAFLSKPSAGTVVAVTESFMLPAASFDGVDVTISLPGSRPRYLRFSRRG